MLKNKGDYKEKENKKYFLFIIILLFFALEKIFNLRSEILFISKLITLCMSIIIFVISRVKIENREINNINYIGLAFIYISIGRFLELENINQIYISRRNIDFFQLVSYLEIINIIAAFILIKVKASIKVQHIVYNLILIKLFYFTEYRIMYYVEVANEDIIYLLNYILKIILLIIYFYLIEKFSSDVECKKEVFKFWGRMLFLCVILEIISKLFNIELLLLNRLLKVYTYIIIYYSIEKVIYNTAYFKAKVDLNRSLRRKTEKNKKLRRREKELFELNKSLEKSEETYYYLLKTFYDVIIIFDDNKLIYTNYQEGYYEDNLNDNKYEERNIDFILKKILGNKYEDIKFKEEFSVVMEKQKDDSSKKILEIELKRIYDNKKVLYINDITKIVDKKEEIINLENKINEENVKDEFYANISHELRTPINVIYSGLQLNSIYIENKEIEKIRGNNKLIKQNCLRLIRTVNNFIDSNKLAENKLLLNKKVYNMVDIIDNIVLSCDYYMKQKNIKVTFDPEFEEVYMLCDKNHIERIMLNILSNSLKYGKEYGNIFLTLLIEEENIVIEVMNDAEAIEESKRKMIFEKFTKINNSLSRPSEGSGLGLFLTKGLVELSGGNIEIISGKEIGNIFKMTLPYDKKILNNEDSSINKIKINELKEKVDIEFSDIYFNI